MMKRSIFFKTRLFNLLLIIPALLVILLLVQCKKDPVKGWSFYMANPPAPKIVNTYAVVKNCVPPYPVSFYQESINLIGNVSYFWDFGDGTTSTDQNPNHLYQNPGVYTAMFIVKNQIGADTAYINLADPQNIDISQSSIPVNSKFNYSHFNNNNYAPNKIIFENNSSGAVFFDWYFGDGGESKNESPEYVFQAQGSYTVKLKGTCTNGEFHETTQQIFVNPAPTKIFIDSINLMLPKIHNSLPIYIEIWHGSLPIGATQKKNPSSYPYKFIKGQSFPTNMFFDNVQFLNNEIFKFLVLRDGVDGPIVLYEIMLSAIDIQNRFYPKRYFQIETVPALQDVFIDLYISY